MRRPATDHTPGHPTDADAVLDRVLHWLREELTDPDIVASDNFLDIGGHSLTFARLNKVLGDEFGVTVDRKITYDDSLDAAVANRTPVDVADPSAP